LVPTRTRLWIAHPESRQSSEQQSSEPQSQGQKKQTSDLRLYGLVLEVSLEKKRIEAVCKDFLEKKNNQDCLEYWQTCIKKHKLVARIRNLFREPGKKAQGDPKFLIAKSESSADKTAKDKPRTEYKEICLSNYSWQESIKTQVEAAIVEDPHMSFLLSRLWADGFTRAQWPFGEEDPFASILGKDRKAPVYAAPILVMRDKPRQKGSRKILESESDPESKFRRQVIGVLAFDSIGLSPRASKPTQAERHITLQNELLHTLDFFTACIAESSKEFRSLIKIEDAGEATP
jgi:hypothetical protein